MPKFKPLPPVQSLRREFEYIPEEGLLLRELKGEIVIAGHYASDGYVTVGFGGPGKMWMAHRLIWKMVTGVDPGNFEIDHINRHRSDNRWCNLRLVDRSSQMANRGVLVTSSSGLKGAYRLKDKSKEYKSSIMRNGRSVYLGAFETAQEAHEAYIRAGGLP